MDNSIYIGISRQTALKSSMDLVANNIANMNTPGYRAQNALFEEYMSKQGKTAEVNDPISMVLNYGQYDNTAPGPLQQTGNALDVALQGPGFIGVVTNDGVEYTRAGNLSLNRQGELVTSSGFKVANLGGAPIIIPEGSRDITIGEDGTISTENGDLGALMVKEFDNYQLLTPKGNGLYSTTEAGRPANGTTVIQGAVEGSNVNAVLEMTRMIDISNTYKSVNRMLQTEHDRQRQAIRTLSQAN